MNDRNTRIARELIYLEDNGVIGGWQSQNKMPGKRWTLWGVDRGGMGGVSFTTQQVEIFINGALSALRTRP